MKNFVLLMSLMVGFEALAYPCPGSLKDSVRGQGVYDWLLPLAGKWSLEGCEVEITICDPENQEMDGSPVGELLILDRFGREVYLPISWSEGGDEKIVTKANLYLKRLEYQKTDRYMEEVFGRTEVYRLDVRVDDDGLIRKLDLGTYSTNRRLNQPNGNQSRWYNCKAVNLL